MPENTDALNPAADSMREIMQQYNELWGEKSALH